MGKILSEFEMISYWIIQSKIFFLDVEEAVGNAHCTLEIHNHLCLSWRFPSWKGLSPWGTSYKQPGLNMAHEFHL